jgi:hypothetical protein
MSDFIADETISQPFIDASSPEAAPKVHSSCMVIDTPQGIERFRMISCLHALSLESKGIKVRRGFSAIKFAREAYGVKARTAVKAHAELEAKMVALGIIERGTK